MTLTTTATRLRLLARVRHSLHEIWPTAFSCSFLLLAIIKAATADLTWDEAWTFLHYGRSWLGWMVLDSSNNHVLNTIFVFLSVHLFGNSEFIVRLPNLAACGLYCWAVAMLLRTARVPALVCALMLLQPFLLDWFALARGYGMAAALITAGIVLHYFVGGGKRYRTAMLGFILAASMAIFPMALLLAGFVVVGVAVRLIQGDRLQWGANLAWLLASVPVLSALMWVSREGVPPIGTRQGLIDALTRNFAVMIVSRRWEHVVGATILLAATVLFVTARPFLTQRSWSLILSLSSAVVLVSVSAAITGRPLPSGRLLVPWYPPFALTIVALVEDWCAASVHGQRISQVAGSVVFAVCFLLFVARYQVNSYISWQPDKHLRDDLVRALVTRHCIPLPILWREGHLYYLDRWFGPAAGAYDKPCPPP